MPDNLDYEALADLLAHPDRWTDEDAATVRFMLTVQREALATFHPKDTKGRHSSQAVIDEMEAALAAYLAHHHD